MKNPKKKPKENNKAEEFIKNPKRALLVLAFPVVIAMLVQTMYNVVDTAFVGRLGAESIAALTFAFPLFFILIALSSGIGVGMNSKISRFLGEKNKKQAENSAMHGILISLVLSLIVVSLGIIFLNPLFSLFGASGNVLKLAKTYMLIILLGVFVMFPGYILSTIFSSQGDTKTPMKIQIIGLIANIILDPIFIYALNFGVAGAAIATDISLFLSLLLSVYYIRKSSYLKISSSSFKFSGKLAKEIFSVGFPASIMIILISIYVVFINRIMSHFSTDYVASFGIASRLETLAILPTVALSVSMITLIGMFYGAKRYDLLRKTSWYGIKLALYFTSFVGILFIAFPGFFLSIFTNDSSLIALSSPYLQLDALTFPLMAIVMISSRILQGMGYGFSSLMIQILRIFIVAIPLAYIFVFLFNLGYLYVALAMILGGMASSIFALFLIEYRFKKLKK